MSDTVSESTDDARPVDDREVSLRLDGVTKTFAEGDGEVVAVDDVSLDIYDGEFLVLVGPSGCGKTTLLRTIAGLEQPTAGRVVIAGRDVAGLEPRERDVAMVFQNYALYPHKTVRENLSFPLQIRKYPAAEVESRVDRTAALLDIPELLDRRPGDLSGGQQQRVALGRAIVRDPELFLFDEPLSNLDAKLRIQMRTELNKLHDRVGKTSVYVTHDQAEAMTLGDRVAVMNDGTIQQVDAPQTLYDHPANRFVAGFIGEPPMNFFDASLVERGDGGHAIATSGFELPVPDEMGDAVRSRAGDPGALVFGIRPEDLYDAAGRPARHGSGEATVGPTDANPTLEALVEVVEPMGSHKLLTLLPPGESSDDDEFTAQVSTDSDAREGEPVTLTVDVRKAHVFDAATGTNLTD